MTDEEQKAESHKYDSSLVWHFAEISPGTFALYSHDRRDPPFITNDWNEVLAHYRARERYVPKIMYKLEEKIDLSKLEIRI